MSPPPTQAVYTIDVYTVHICTGINLNLGCEMRGVMGSLWNPARPSVRLMVRTRSRDLGGLVERQAGQAESGLCIWRWGAGCGGITVGGGSGAKAVLRPEPGERAAAGKCLKPDRTRWNLKDSKVGGGGGQISAPGTDSPREAIWRTRQEGGPPAFMGLLRCPPAHWLP